MSYKFIVCVDGLNYTDNFTDEQLDCLVYQDEPQIHILELEHENFRDNIVEIGTEDDYVEVVRDIKGQLYYFTDYYSSSQLLKELTSKSINSVME